MIIYVGFTISFWEVYTSEWVPWGRLQKANWAHQQTITAKQDPCGEGLLHEREDENKTPMETVSV